MLVEKIFTCPKCAGHRLEEVMVGVTRYTKVLVIHFEEEYCEYVDGEDHCITSCSHDGAIVSYRCMACHQEVARSFEGLRKLLSHKIQRILDVQKAMESGTTTLGKPGLFRGEKASIRRYDDDFHVVVTLPESLSPDMEHLVPIDCLEPCVKSAKAFAEDIFGSFDFGCAVEDYNGFESTGNALFSRVVYLENHDGPSLKADFTVDLRGNELRAYCLVNGVVLGSKTNRTYENAQ